MSIIFFAVVPVVCLIVPFALANAARRMSEQERRWEQWQRPPDDDGCTEVKFDDPGE